MSEETSTATQGISLDQKAIDILVANIIPTSKYFEIRFDHMQHQIDDLKTGQKNLLDTMEKRFDTMQTDMDKRFGGMQSDMDKRFGTMQTEMDKRFGSMQSDMDKRFEQVDKRFEQIDKRFEQVDASFVSLQTDMDRRFQQVDDKLDKILDRIDRRIDEGLRENRAQAMRMFTFAMTFSAISMMGLIGKFLKLY